MDSNKNPTSNKKKFNTLHHTHPILYLSSKDKGYNNEDWFCDVCKNTYEPEINSMHCSICDWDLCFNCFTKEFQYLE